MKYLKLSSLVLIAMLCSCNTINNNTLNNEFNLETKTDTNG